MKTAITALGIDHPHSPGLQTTAKVTACKLQQVQGWATEFTSFLPASLGFCGVWHRPYFMWVLLFVLFCMTTLELNRIQRKANPVTEDPRKACPYNFVLTLAASKWSLAQAAQQAGTKRFCKCTVIKVFLFKAPLSFNEIMLDGPQTTFSSGGLVMLWGCGWLGSCNPVRGWGAGIHCEVNLVYGKIQMKSKGLLLFESQQWPIPISTTRWVLAERCRKLEIHFVPLNLVSSK